MTPPILVIEDDMGILEYLTDLLADEGYTVMQATNGQTALEFLQLAPTLPALILTDLMMPIMDGWTFCRERLRYPALAQIPVVVLSAAHDLAQQVQELQVVAALPKPVDIDVILAVVDQYVITNGDDAV